MTSIRGFRITNLAGSGGVIERTLDPQVNIFWGLNGTGKTTLLRILDAALSNKTSSLRGLPFDTAEVLFYSDALQTEIVRRIDQKKSTAQLSLLDEEDWQVIAENELDQEMSFRLGRNEADPAWDSESRGHALSAEDLANTYRHGYLPISRMLDVSADRHMPESSADERFVRRVNTVWSRYSAKSLAEIRDIQQRGLAEVLAILFGGKGQSDPELDGIGPEDQDLETHADDAYRIVSEFLIAQRIILPLGKRDFTARYDESEDHRNVVTRIQSVMKQVDAVLGPQKELQAVIEEMYIGNKHLVLNRGSGPRGRVSVEINDQSIPLSSLSSGEKQLLQILLETLAVEESTLMIDEPEISLHPDWQNGLVGSMRRVNPEAQFLLATHSPELMVGVPDECVFEL